MKDVSTRFYEKIIGSPDTSCHIWQGSKMKQGYGRFSIRNKVFFAHRVSYELTYDYIPSNMCVLHTCDNPSCVNPEHLFLGTKHDNTQDRLVKQRGIKKLTVEQVLAIRQDTITTSIDLAKKYNVHKDHINAIKARLYWKHI